MFHHDLVVNANRGLAENSLAELLRLSINRTSYEKYQQDSQQGGRSSERAGQWQHRRS